MVTEEKIIQGNEMTTDGKASGRCLLMLLPPHRRACAPVEDQLVSTSSGLGRDLHGSAVEHVEHGRIC